MQQITVSSTLSMEEVEAGCGMPYWLAMALSEGRKLMIIHPGEAARKQAIAHLHSMRKEGIVDSSLHLTIERFVKLLHLDLRLPAVMEDNGITFEITHQALKSHANDYGFPLIQSNPKHNWTRSRSQRILALHSQIIGLLKPQNWEDDPGAMTCDQVIRSLEKSRGMTHHSRVAKVVLEQITKTSQVPFSLRDVDGIIMLNHANGLTEVELSILERISNLVNLHQLVNPGSYRLGFHGEYISDIHPIKSDSDLPTWVPPHELWVSNKPQEWRSTSSNTEIFHLMLESENHSAPAIADILSKLDDEDVTIVDGNALNLEKKLAPYLDNFGIRLRGKSIPVSSSSAVSRILSLIDISKGEEAWSLNRLQELEEQTNLPLRWEILDLEHPLNSDWSPKLNSETLVEIARGFHVLGGRGSLRRWLSTLSKATPRIAGDEKQSKYLEESQWWLASISRWMHPILSEKDRIVSMEPCIGCISGKELPLPDPPEDIISWFNSLLDQIDWLALSERDLLESNAIPGLQHLVETISILSQESTISFGENDFSEMLENLARNTTIPSRRGTDLGFRVLTPQQALGTTSEILILSGMDSQTWSMKPPTIPWLDENSRMKLGLNKPDERLRKGRHHLRHLLNSAKVVIILDSSLQDGIELSGPLEEWFNIVANDEEVKLENAPPFLSLSDWSPKTPNRSWCWQTIPGVGLRLVHKVSSMEMTGLGVHTHRSGILPRDNRQRAGLALIEDREMTEPPLNPESIAIAAKNELIPDQFSRRKDTALEGEIRTFENSGNLIRTYDYKMTPNRNNPPNSRNSPIWPHLGYHTESESFLGIDPRPITPSSTNLVAIDVRTGLSQVNLKLPKVWSQSRLQSWLFCPRKAWYEKHLKLGTEEEIPEDLAANARGNIVHFVAQAIFEAHLTSNLPDKLSSLQSGLKTSDLWDIALNTLIDKAPWMKRADGISAHRCKDLIGVTPSVWNSWLEGELDIPIGGRIGRMILEELSMINCAPIACEWQINSGNQNFVTMTLPSSPEKSESESSFNFTGVIDRVDALLIDYEFDDNATILPLDIDLNENLPTSQLVIIRDIKSLDGPRDNGKDLRHMKGLFEELQLALYARSWEITNPGHRVVGVGVTQVGIETQSWVEIDPDFIDLVEEKSIGNTTQYLVNQYRRPGEGVQPKSNPFRAWMRERISTANRVIEMAKSGQVPCNCSTIDSCRCMDRRGW